MIGMNTTMKLLHGYREVQLEELEEATSQPTPRVLRSSRLKKPKVSTDNLEKPKIVPMKETTPEVSTDSDRKDTAQPIKIDPKSSNFNKF